MISNVDIQFEVGMWRWCPGRSVCLGRGYDNGVGTMISEVVMNNGLDVFCEDVRRTGFCFVESDITSFFPNMPH